MSAYYKVRNDASVSSLSRICMRIHELIDAPVLVDIAIKDVKDVRIYLMPPRSAAALVELRKDMPEWASYLKVEEIL